MIDSPRGRLGAKMPLLDDDQLSAAVRARKIIALSLDTTVFHRLGYDLEALSLRPLSQFFGSDVAFVLTDVVVAEVRKHLLVNAMDQVQRARSVLRDLGQSRRIGPEAISQAAQALELSADLAAEIDGRWHRFAVDFAPVILDAGTALDGAKLLSDYFAGNAPFGSAKKKQEFPDAIALQELEALATERDGIVLTVSHDTDWRSYAEHSEGVAVIDDIATAISLFVDAGAWTADQLSGLLELEDSPITRDVVAALNAFVQRLRPEIVAQSNFEVDGDFVDAQLLSYEMPAADQIVIIEADATNALVAFPVALTLEINAVFGFFAYNTDAEEWVGLGSSEERVEHEATVRVVARIPRDLREDDRATEVRVEASVRFPVHFGETRPDFGRD
jgi:hypothetical protein